MNWKEFLKPTKKKVIITIFCVLIIPLVIGFIWDFFDLPGSFTVLLTQGFLYSYAGIHCTYVPTGIDWVCYALKTIYWWITNTVIYYLLVSIVYYKFKK